MKNNALLLFISSLFSLFNPGLSLGDPSVSPEILASVVLLSSEKDGHCATGFVLDSGEILTNAHVTQALCPTGGCGGIKISRAAALNSAPAEKLKVVAASLDAEIPSLDAAVLRVSTDPPLQGVFRAGGVPTSGMQVLSLGFPECRTLTLVSGSVVTTSNLSFETNLQGTYGASGSPIFLSDGTVIGIAGESSSVIEAIKTKLMGGNFSLRGAPLATIPAYLGKNRDTIIALEAEALVKNWVAQISTISGLARVREGLEYSSAVMTLKSFALKSRLSSNAISRFLLCGEHLSALPSFQLPQETASRPLLHALDKLCLTFSLEHQGPFLRFLEKINPESFDKSLSDSGRTPDEVKSLSALISRSLDSDYPGVELYFLEKIALWGLVALIFSALLCFSSGYVYALTPGGFLKKLLVVFLVTLVWPITLIPWVIWRRRARTAP